MADISNAIASFKACVTEALSDAVTVGDVVQKIGESHLELIEIAAKLAALSRGESLQEVNLIELGFASGLHLFELKVEKIQKENTNEPELQST